MQSTQQSQIQRVLQARRILAAASGPAAKQIKRPRARNSQARNISSTIAPVSTGTIVRLRGPRIRANENSCTVSRRELVGTFTGDGTAYQQVRSQSLNPGLPSFGAVSSQAQSWERYRFDKLRFEWIPSCPTTTVGNVLMVIDYDPTDPFPDNEVAFSQAEGAQEGSVFQRMTVSGNAKQLFGFGGPKFIRTGFTRDPRTTDAGTLFLALANVPVGSSGKLYVEYSITFQIPASPEVAIPYPLSNQILFGVAAGQVLPTASPSSILWDTVANLSGPFNVFGLSVGGGGTSILFPAGGYRVRFSVPVTCTDISTGFNVSLTISSTAVSYFQGVPADIEYSGVAASPLNLCQILIHRDVIVGSNSPFSLTATATATGSGVLAVPASALSRGSPTVLIAPA